MILDRDLTFLDLYQKTIAKGLLNFITKYKNKLQKGYGIVKKEQISGTAKVNAFENLIPSYDI